MATSNAVPLKIQFIHLKNVPSFILPMETGTQLTAKKFYGGGFNDTCQFWEGKEERNLIIAGEMHSAFYTF